MLGAFWDVFFFVVVACYGRYTRAFRCYMYYILCMLDGIYNGQEIRSKKKICCKSYKNLRTDKVSSFAIKGKQNVYPFGL